MSAINNKYDITILFDAKNSNPNGNPDADNMPRQYVDNGIGYVTDVCIKRKIRDFVMKAVHAGMIPADGHDIYIQGGMALDARELAIVKDTGLINDEVKLDGKDAKESKDNKAAIMKKLGSLSDKEDLAIHDEACARYFDIRAFGAVMTTMANTRFSKGINGPVQVSFAQSIDPIEVEPVSVFRCAVTKKEDEAKNATFGNKWIVPYGLYKMSIHISALKAKETGFSDDDLNLLLDALVRLFDDDYSAARGDMNMRKIVLFKHDSAWGNAPYSKLDELIHIEHKDGVDAIHNYEDYNVTIDTDNVPNGVTAKVIL